MKIAHPAILYSGHLKKSNNNKKQIQHDESKHFNDYTTNQPVAAYWFGKFVWG